MRRTDKYDPIFMFYKYMELIYEVDELWDEFQRYLRDIMPKRRGDKFFEHHREPQSMDVWHQMLENMGGGWPTITFAAAAFLLLRYQAMGHDLEKELRAVHRAKIKRIAKDLLKTAINQPDGTETTTVALLEAAGYEVLCHERELPDLHNALLREAKKTDVDLDMSENEGTTEEHPYSHSFIIRYGKNLVKCPKCGSRKIALILYGMPEYDEEMEQKINNQELYLGGCCISDTNPLFHCFGCGKDFGRLVTMD